MILGYLGDIGPIDEPPPDLPKCPDCGHPLIPNFDAEPISGVADKDLTCFGCRPVYGPCREVIDEIPF